MADRTVKVTLLASVQGYLAGMDQAAAKTRQMSQDSQARLAQQSQAFDALGRTAFAVGTLAVAGVALAIAKFSEFDAAISNVKAITQETAENMELLRDAALEAGGRTVFTATEAANAIEQLGRNGLTTAQILGGGLDAALDLAAAGGLEVARAAEIAAITTKQFGLAGRDIPQVADLLAAGAGKAAGDVEDLAQALSQAGLVAAQTGVSVEETTGTLAAFADAGLLGSDAGTSLRTMLLRLTPQSKEAAAAMRELGINGFDPLSGEFIGLEALAGNLRSSLGDLTTEQRNLALTQIFGQDAIRGANRLYELGADGLRDYIEQTNDSGYAARVAADRLDNLRGDVEKLGGAFDTALIQQGSAANDSLRAITQSLTFLVEASGDLPPVAVNIGAVVGVLGLVSGSTLLAIPKIDELRTAFRNLGVSAKGASIAIGGVTAALTIVTFLVTDFIAKQAESAAATDAFRDSLDQTTGAVTDYTRELAAKRLQELNAFDQAKALGVQQDELTDAVLNNEDAFRRVNDQLREGAGINIFAYNDAFKSLVTVAMEMQNAEKEFDDLDAAQRDAADSAEGVAYGLAEIEGAAYDASGAVDELSQQILNFGRANLDAREAERRFQSAIDDVTDSLNENGTSLDTNTREGNANEASLDALAEAALARAAAILKMTGDEEAATEAVAQGRQALLDAAAQFGLTGEAAEAYADQVGLIPKNIEQIVALNTDPAEIAFQNFLRKYEGKVIRLTADGTAIGPGMVARAGGGILPGAPSNRDNMIIRAASGEYVTNAAATSIPANRAALEYMNAGGNISGFPGAGGYMVSAPTAAPTVNLSFANGMEWLRNFVQVEVSSADQSRQQTLSAGRQVR